MYMYTYIYRYRYTHTHTHTHIAAPPAGGDEAWPAVCWGWLRQSRKWLAMLALGWRHGFALTAIVTAREHFENIRCVRT